MKKSVLIGAATMAMVGLSAWAGNVWEDAKQIYNNVWNDANGNGIIDNNEYLNDRNPNTYKGSLTFNCGNTHPFRDTVMRTVYVTNMNVQVLGTGGQVLTNEPCLYFDPKTIVTNGTFSNTGVFTPGAEQTLCLCNFFQLDNPVTMNPKNDSYTCLFRYRPEFFMAPGDDRRMFLIGFGPSNNYAGSHLQYVLNPSGTGGRLRVNLQKFGNTGSYTLIESEELMLTNNVWCDIAFIAASNRVEVGVRFEKIKRAQDDRKTDGNGQGHGHFTWVRKDFEPKGNGDPAGDGYYHLCPPYNYQRMSTFHNGWYPARASDFAGIKGAVHGFAMWNRALTRYEVNEYFSEGRPALMKIGPGGTGTSGTEWLKGTAGATVTITNRPSQWRFLPSTLAKNAKVNVRFEVSDRYASLPQVVLITPAQTSCSGEVDVALDGVKLATMPVAPGKKEAFFVDGEKFTQGWHTFTIERSDEGAGNLVLNAYELTGSWQVGKDDGKHVQTGINDNDFTSSHVFAEGYYSKYQYLPYPFSSGWDCDFNANARTAHYKNGGFEDYHTYYQFALDQDLLDAGYRFDYQIKADGFFTQYANTDWVQYETVDGVATNTHVAADYAKGNVIKRRFDATNITGGEHTLMYDIDVLNYDAAGGAGKCDQYNVTPYADCFRMVIKKPAEGLLILVQ